MFDKRSSTLLTKKATNSADITPYVSLDDAGFVTGCCINGLVMLSMGWKPTPNSYAGEDRLRTSGWNYIANKMRKRYGGETGRVVSTVCHGATGLLNVNLSTGEPLIKGKKVTGFSWPEEIIAKRDDVVPFNLEEEMKKIGADYSKADKPWEVHVIEDGRLITGQNPSSARGVAEAVIKRLKTRDKR